MKEKKFPMVWGHVLTIGMLLLLPYFFSPKAFWGNPMARKDTLLLILGIGFFYFHYLYMLPKLYYQNKKAPYFLLLLLLLAIVCLLPEVLFKHLPNLMENRPHFHKPRHMHRGGPPFFISIRNNLIVFLLSWALSGLLRISMRLQEAEKMKQKAELSNLKAQVNPHFLFNSLNTIYALAIAQSEQAGDAVLKLSGIMRFVLMESEKDRIPLSKEIVYLQDYISLQKLRLGPEFTIAFNLEIEDEGIPIAPLLLIPLVENAFKHGVNQEDIHPIEISLKTSNRQLSFKTYNKKVSKIFVNDYPGGLGLENLKLRLDYLYPNKYELLTEDKDGFFSIHFSLSL